MRLALAQINPTVGAPDANAERITRWIDRARAAGADLVILPELCLCGYPPRDLLLREGFVEACASIADRLGASATAGLTAIFGSLLRRHPGDPASRITNSLIAYRDNRPIARYDKRLLPTYDVFDEDRYFTPGDRPVVIDIGGLRIGLAICEDLWKGEDAGFADRYLHAPDPVAELAREGMDVLVSPSASPFVLGKGARHRAILRHHAQAHRVWVAAVNQVGGNDDLVFDGHAALFAPDGTLVAAARGFEEDLLLFDIPAPGPLTPVPCGPVPCGDVGSPVPCAMSPRDPLLEAPREEILYRALVLGTRDYLRKTGHTAGIVGISGGIDSAVTAAIAAAALGPANILGLIMPGRYSSEHSRADALDLARRLGIRTLTIPIDPPFAGFRTTLDPAFEAQGLKSLGASLPDTTEENLQARIRGTTLMAVSNRTGALVLTTGNKSELAVGYCTLYGDMNGGYAVLCDVAKMQVYALARWMNATWEGGGCGIDGLRGPPIPQRSIDKPPSAELRPDQTDQDTLPPYEVLDAIIERYVEGQQAPTSIAAATGLDLALVRRIARMIDVAEFKRRQLAMGPKVTSVAFGTGRRYPIAQGWRAV